MQLLYHQSHQTSWTQLKLWLCRALKTSFDGKDPRLLSPVNNTKTLAAAKHCWESSKDQSRHLRDVRVVQRQTCCQTHRHTFNATSESDPVVSCPQRPSYLFKSKKKRHVRRRTVALNVSLSDSWVEVSEEGLFTFAPCGQFAQPFSRKHPVGLEHKGECFYRKKRTEADVSKYKGHRRLMERVSSAWFLLKLSQSLEFFLRMLILQLRYCLVHHKCRKDTEVSASPLATCLLLVSVLIRWTHPWTHCTDTWRPPHLSPVTWDREKSHFGTYNCLFQLRICHLWSTALRKVSW